jgi:hypothetical protein
VLSRGTMQDWIYKPALKRAIEVALHFGSGLRLGLPDSDPRLGAGDKLAVVTAVAKGGEFPVPLHPPGGRLVTGT